MARDREGTQRGAGELDAGERVPGGTSGRGDATTGRSTGASGGTGGATGGTTGGSMGAGGAAEAGRGDDASWGSGAASSGMSGGAGRSSFYSRAEQRRSMRGTQGGRGGASGGASASRGAYGGASSGGGYGAGQGGGYGAGEGGQYGRGEGGRYGGGQGGAYDRGSHGGEGYAERGYRGGTGDDIAERNRRIGLPSDARAGGFERGGGYSEIDRGAGESRGGFQQGGRGAREWGSWDARGGSGAPGSRELESGYRESGAGGRERLDERFDRGGHVSGSRDWHDEETERRLRSGGTYERDASADVGLGYRDFGAGAGAGAAADRQRRTRWQREPTAAREVMTKNPKAVGRDASVHEIARIMRDENTGVVPVVDQNGSLVGLVTDRDIVMRSLSEGRNPLELRAQDVMTDDVEAVTPDESLREVVEMMGDHQIRRVPVVDRNDRLVGIISMGDVATRADFDEDLQDALEEISARRSFWSKLFG